MANYLKGNICARVRLGDDGILSVDRSTVTVGDGEDYWATARRVTDQPGAMVVVWLVDNLVIDDWREGALDVDKALRFIGMASPNWLLLRAEFDTFFQVPRCYTDSVRLMEEDTVRG